MRLRIITGGNVDLSAGSTVALIGAMIMGVRNNGMPLIGLPRNLLRIVKGLVLLMAVAFDAMSKNNRMTPFLCSARRNK